MSSRSLRRTISFSHPFSLRGLVGKQPPGDYLVETDEESIEGISFLAFRRVATNLEISRDGTTQIFPVDPTELEVALMRDSGGTVPPIDPILRYEDAQSGR